MCTAPVDETHLPVIIKDISTVITPLLAIFLTWIVYKRTMDFNKSKTIVEKQLDLVHKLRDYINGLSILVYTNKFIANTGEETSLSDNLPYTGLFYDNFRTGNDFLSRDAYFDERPLLITLNTMVDFGLNEYLNNTLLPETIKKAILNLRFRTDKKFKQEDINKTFELYTELCIGMDFSEYEFATSKNIPSFKEFYSLSIDLFKAINKWLYDNGGEDLMFKKT